MSTTIISFEIYNLFNQYDVILPLENTVNIFLGENGMGKTTILNCINHVLNGSVEKLSTVLFDHITVRFSDNTKLTISSQDILNYLGEYSYSNPRFRKRILSSFTDKEVKDLEISYYNNDDLSKYYSKISDIFSIPSGFAKHELENFVIAMFGQSGKAQNVEDFKKSIKQKLSDQVLYLPTYRRIEADMAKLGVEIDRDKVKNELMIKFGVADVEKAIFNTLSTIKDTSLNGFNKMTGILLEQYLGGELLPNDDYMIDQDKLSIALDRIGEKIEYANKLRIKELVEKKMIYDRDHKYLLNLIKNLIASYEGQSKYDEMVKKFVNTCNRYFTNKRFFYDESNVELGIYKYHELPNSDNPIELHNLSSGEKQVVSIFSKLYLESTGKYIVLFDEPELSLSIKWQTRFLPDIMKSDRCSMLIAVTHSPFIFDNEYDMIAKDMGNFITESRK